MKQTFLFSFPSTDAVVTWLRGLASLAVVDERPGFFVFEQLPGEAAFSFDCELIEGGLKSERSGHYFAFLGMFIESLTGQFGALVVEDF